MKYFIKFGVCFLFFFLVPLICLAGGMEEKGLRVNPLISKDKVTLIKVMIDSANGKPAINTLQLDYPPATVLITSASLTVKKGLYKIELLENDKPVVTLSSQEGKTVKTSGRMIMDAEGVLQYRVSAKNAKGIAFDLSFTPYQEELRISRASTEEKLSLNGDVLKLKLTCVEGKDCMLQAQNLSRSKACRNISFQIDYKMITQAESVEKNKSGTIAELLLPGKTSEWPVGLIFGEPPKDIKISVIKADAVDAAGVTVPEGNQQKNSTIELLPIAPLSGQPAPAGN